MSEEIIHHDEFGKEYVLDEESNRRLPCILIGLHKAVISLLMIQVKDTVVYVVVLLVEVNALNE